MLKGSQQVFMLALIALGLSSSFWFSPNAANAAGQHSFPVKQYEAFHDVLHPLQHEALPKNDFKTIRAQSRLLVKRGTAIVSLGIPRSVIKDQRGEFGAELRKFSKALAKFRADARTGTDDQLKTSFSAVHDSFEMLAGMVRV